ncbi:hypothetical protein ES705_49169 [subsurface metagenome]
MTRLVMKNESPTRNEIQKPLLNYGLNCYPTERKLVLSPFEGKALNVCFWQVKWLFVQSEPSSNLTQSLEGIPGER